MTTPHGSPALDARYGRTPARGLRARILAIAAGAGVLVAVVAWVVWGGLLGPSASLETRDLGYTVRGPHSVEIRYEVTVDAGRTVSCALEALSTDFEIVGWKIVAMPAADRATRRFTDTIRTSEPAVTGLIYRCWLT